MVSIGMIDGHKQGRTSDGIESDSEVAMELRHLDTLVAIAEEGSFTAAADALATVQSNVSDQVRQLEGELGAPLLVRSRRGAEPTEFGLLVLDRARRVQRELEALRGDIALLQGLETGYARLGVVGTASRWLVPALVTDLRERAPGVRLRVNEGASERLFGEVVDGELAQAVVTEPVNDRRLSVETLLEEDVIGLVRRDVDLPREPVPLAVFAQLSLVLPPEPNPLRIEVERAAEEAGITLRVPVEVEGIRLIADLVLAGDFASILPETAIPPELADARTVRISGLPPRRLAMVSARDTQMSLADQAVRDSVRSLVETHLQTRSRPHQKLRSRTTRR
jgi:LysR family hydrogen peroxide-inducible transcriptional activator